MFREGEKLFPFITRYIKKVPERSVLVITSKILALSEKRTAPIKNSRTKAELIRKESEVAIRTKYVWLTIKDGMMMASAGIDESNANGKLILLPHDSFAAAHALRNELRRLYRIKHLGVLITDSRTIPLRLGVTGVAVGYAGFRGVRDYRGAPDIFGRKFKFARTNVADSLATAATLLMGEGNEQQPLALIQNAPIEFCEKVALRETHIDINEDMYKPLFVRLPKSRR
ncbi:MAG: coenzyme F420-0:L-glutamate ligase [Candidatus Liptonbacteria bacterium]|nr:coenzyme F420-0:L-glutamate ligase [Candidatus Liptonbacteria bacterium]